MQREESDRGEKTHRPLLLFGPLSGKLCLLNIIIGWGHPEVNTVIGPAPC